MAQTSVDSVDSSSALPKLLLARSLAGPHRTCRLSSPQEMCKLSFACVCVWVSMGFHRWYRLKTSEMRMKPTWNEWSSTQIFSPRRWDLHSWVSLKGRQIESQVNFKWKWREPKKMRIILTTWESFNYHLLYICSVYSQLPNHFPLSLHNH